MTAAVSAQDVPSAPTLADVARLARVSSATASRVLTGSTHVHPDTRRRVEAAMAQLGYVRNRAPRGGGERSRQAGAIALVVAEENVKVFADPFFARILRGVSRELAVADIQLVLLTLHAAREYRSAARYLRGGHVDGAIFISMHSGPAFDIAGLGIPAVLCGRPVGGGDGVGYVDADNVAGARAAVSYLLGTGRTAVATIAGPPDMSPGIDRLAGYQEALSAAGAAGAAGAAAGADDPGMIAYGDFTRRSGEHAVARLIDHRPRLDAIFAASDLMALGALSALRRLGRRVPDDVAVLGFDDLPQSRHVSPRLSTVRQPVDDMAVRMVCEMLALVGDPGREPARVILDTELILRDSA